MPALPSSALPSLRSPFALLCRLLLSCLILLSVPFAPVRAADWPVSPEAVTPSLRFKKLGPLGGDEPSMLALLQDRQGYVWVGTHTNGLYRYNGCLLYTSPSPRDGLLSRMPSSA